CRRTSSSAPTRSRWRSSSSSTRGASRRRSAPPGATSARRARPPRAAAAAPRRLPAARPVLDLRLIRREPDLVRSALARRGADHAAAIERVLDLDGRWRAATEAAEGVKAELNAASRALRGAPSPEERERLAALSARGRDLSDEVERLRRERDEVLVTLPNLPAGDAPDQDTVLKEVGTVGRTGRDHLELAGPRID